VTRLAVTVLLLAGCYDSFVLGDHTDAGTTRRRDAGSDAGGPIVVPPPPPPPVDAGGTPLCLEPPVHEGRRCRTGVDCAMGCGDGPVPGAFERECVVDCFERDRPCGRCLVAEASACLARSATCCEPWNRYQECVEDRCGVAITEAPADRCALFECEPELFELLFCFPTADCGLPAVALCSG